MKRRVLLGLVVALGGTGCPDEAPPDAGAEDAAGPQVRTTHYEDSATGVRFTSPSTWQRTSSPSTEDEVQTLARVVRKNTQTPVLPRLALTREPTTLSDPDLAARRTKNVLEAQLESAGAKIRRATLARRAISGRFVGALDLTYAVPSGSLADPVEVRHRSLVAVIPTAESALAIITLTATYLARDHAIIGGEVDAVLDSFTLPAAATVAPSPKTEE